MKDFLSSLGFGLMVLLIVIATDGASHFERIDCHAAGGRWVHRDGCSSNYCEEPRK
jgi:hypothetical protein